MRKLLTSQIDISASPEQIWAVLSDLAAYREWNPFIVEAEGQTEVGKRLTLRMQPVGGKVATFRPTVLASQAGRELRWLGRLGIPGLLDAAHGFTIEPLDAGGSRLLQEELFRGLLVRPLARSLDRGTLAAFRAMNAALRERAEQAADRRGRQIPLPGTADSPKSPST